MKLFLQLTILATFLASLTQAELREESAKADALAVLKAHRDLKSHHKSYSKSYSKSHSKSYSGDAEGELGVRRECSDKRFTVVCEWEATLDGKKKSHSKSKSKSWRKLGEETALDYEEEAEENDRQLETVYTGAGRYLKVELQHVKCILGVGKKDSDDSDEDYHEFTERVKFPSDDWMLKIKAGKDGAGELADYYKFTAPVKFDDLDTSTSTDEITATIEIELLDAGDGNLVIDDQCLKFDC